MKLFKTYLSCSTSTSIGELKMKKTSDIKVVEICREQFNFALPSVQLDCRCRNFDNRLVLSTDLVKFFPAVFVALHVIFLLPGFW